MERIAGRLSRTRVLAVLFVLLVVNGALFMPAQHGVVPDAPGIGGMPTVTHLDRRAVSGQPRRVERRTLRNRPGHRCAVRLAGHHRCGRCRHQDSAAHR